MAQAQRDRELAIPMYPDNSCHIARSCLDCPLPKCWFELTDGEKHEHRRVRGRDTSYRNQATGKPVKAGPAPRAGVARKH